MVDEPGEIGDILGINGEESFISVRVIVQIEEIRRIIVVLFQSSFVPFISCDQFSRVSDDKLPFRNPFKCFQSPSSSVRGSIDPELVHSSLGDNFERTVRGTSTGNIALIDWFTFIQEKDAVLAVRSLR